ncbi:MAG: tetratricopeptide repeat protein [Chloroherpetonaceae bacterium]|nr:tetratricopeptide repeat protein [Chloroherpetonaceae bacterium]MCS7210959.1 tetratricopeptide repeat protein [Chloroherpetonaceae bacterium]MDW8020245.1 tetratricopeptide repeat protein [Chloroherpetonaceae bacterium]
MKSFHHSWLVLVAAVWYSPHLAAAQPLIDSLKRVVETADGTCKVDALNALARAYWRAAPDSTLQYALQAQALAEQIGYKRGLEKALNAVSYMYEVQAQYAKAIEVRLRDMELSKEIEDDTALAWCYHSMGNLSTYQGNNDQALAWHFKALELREKIGDLRGKGWSLNNIAWVFENQNQLDKALEYREKAAAVWRTLHDVEGLAATTGYQADVYSRQGKHELALARAHEAIRLLRQAGISLTHSWLQLGKFYIAAAKYDSALMALDSALHTGEKRYFPRIHNALAQCYFLMHRYDDGIRHAQVAIKLAQQGQDKVPLEEAYRIASALYEAKNDFKQAYACFKAYSALHDSMRSLATQNQIMSREVNYQIGLREKEIEQLRKEQTAQATIRNMLIALVIFAVIILLLLYWRYRASLRAKQILQHKNEELSAKNALIEIQHAKLKQAFRSLQNTQQQLVQQEKLAALGEIAAGISHEIQNPLNFVSNFVSLAQEQSEELSQMLADDAVPRRAIQEKLESLKVKLERVAHHTLRASRIVKSILEHSKNGRGEREETDLNLLLKEYAQLGYHSYKMRDLSFNVALRFDLDSNLPKFFVVPQDFSRVFLNLVQNAFYSTYHKQQALQRQSEQNFSPEVRVSSHALPNAAQIRIWDNGFGVAPDLHEKIFQPFFTTKPGTEGTGLGLSISRDIITAYGGKIWLESREGEYAEFIIELPYTAMNAHLPLQPVTADV